MMDEQKTTTAVRLFFDECASRIPVNPSMEDLCAASSKDTRIWARPDIYTDLMESLCHQLDIRIEHQLLEVGCAAGFLAVGLAKLCTEYVGSDVSSLALRRASKLNIPNTAFRLTDGISLPFPSESFDRTVCYDVFTNFSDKSVVRQMINEMCRVTKSGGKILVGALPDETTKDAYSQKAQNVAQQLDDEFGPRAGANRQTLPWILRFRNWYLRRKGNLDHNIINYFFRKADFQQFGNENNAETLILDNHLLSPYRGFRFNVVYTKCKAAA